MFNKDLGMVTAYAYAVSKGYTGTEEEFAALMADYADVGERAEAAEQDAQAAKTAAEGSATAAAASATQAQESTTRAAQKASEASASATAAAISATNAEAAKTDAETAQTAAEAAKDTAVANATTATTKAAEAAQSASSAADSETAAEAAATRAEHAAASLTVDSALSETSENPVQNKVVTGAVTQLKSAITNNLLTDSVKDAIINCFAHVAWDDEHGQDYYDALETVLHPPVSISAVYTQVGKVYDTDTLESLKSDLVVTATYADSSTEVVTNYTLSGTLTVGTSTITVSYVGKTTMFTVTVTEDRIPTGYTHAKYVASLSTTSSGPHVNTGVTPSANGTLNIDIGCMLTTQVSEYQYCIAMNSSSGYGGAVGAGVGISNDGASAVAYTGALASISPKEGKSLLNEYIDLTATLSSASATITDGTLTDTTEGTARGHGYPIHLFGLQNREYEAVIEYPYCGRIYYAKVYDDGTLILDIEPCVRNSDNAPGFYDYVNDNFITASGLTAG